MGTLPTPNHNLATFALILATRSFVQCHNDTSKDEEEELHAPWKDFKLSVTNWVIILSAVVVFWIALSIVLACFCGPHSQECHLCEQPVPRKLWENGEHRKTCSLEHERFLHDLPKATYKSAICKHCSKVLDVWPPNLGQPGFKCQLGRDCDRKRKKKKRRRRPVDIDPEEFEFSVDENGKPVEPEAEFVDCENNGENRLCCFEHDYNICDRCAIFLDRVHENGILTSSLGGINRIRLENGSSKKSSDAWVNDGMQLQTLSKTVTIREASQTNGIVLGH